MRMIRGTGLRGWGDLSRIVVEDDDGESLPARSCGHCSIRRRELEQYLKDIGQPWREDSTNADDRFTRNRCASWCCRCWSRSSIPRWRRICGTGGDRARRRGLLGERSLGMAGNHGAVVGAGVGARLAADGNVLVQIQLGAAGSRTAGQSRQSDRRSEDSNRSRRPWLVMNASVEPDVVSRRAGRRAAQAGQGDWRACRDSAGVQARGRDPAICGGGLAATGKELSLPLGWKLVLEPEATGFRRLPDSAQSSEFVNVLGLRIRAAGAGASACPGA